MNMTMRTLEDRVAQEDHLFDAREAGPERACRRYLVLDLEFRYDRSRHAGYTAAEGRNFDGNIRWPFHRISCASWLPITYVHGERRIVFGELGALSRRETDERAIVEAVFEAIENHSDAPVVTWGGECKDFPTLRRTAAEFGLILPASLLDRNPFTSSRLDLCNEVAGRAAYVHLPEYAHATGIPCKPAKSKDIGRFVENGDWTKVENQCSADVITTSLILLRHLISRREIDAEMIEAIDGLMETASQAASTSHFVTGTLGPWARDLKRRAGLHLGRA